MGFCACQERSQQLFVLHVRRKRVALCATSRTAEFVHWPSVWSTFNEFRHACVACPLVARATLRRAFRTRGDANGTFRTGHLKKRDSIIISHARDRSREKGTNRCPRLTQKRRPTDGYSLGLRNSKGHAPPRKEPRAKGDWGLHERQARSPTAPHARVSRG